MASLVHRGRYAQLALLFAIACALPACVESEELYFRSSGELTPFREGRYQIYRHEWGRWTKEAIGSLQLTGHSYSWKYDLREIEITGTIYDAGDSYLVAASRGKERGKFVNEYWYYFLLEKIPEGYLSYQPDCQDLIKLRAMPEALRPRHARNQRCKFIDQKHLVQALKAFARRSSPDFLIVPLTP